MIKQFIPQDFCLKCRGCCRFKEQDSIWSPTLLDEEIQSCLFSAAPAGKKIRLTPSSQKLNNFLCPFLNTEDNKCAIYENRPFECQLYPSLINRKEGKIFLSLDLNCPFIKNNLESKELYEYLENLGRLLNSPQYKKTFKNNPQIIQEYPEAACHVEIII